MNNRIGQRKAERVLFILFATGLALGMIFYLVGQTGAITSQSPLMTSSSSVPDTSRVSNDYMGGNADGESKEAAISANGRFVSFVSIASDIIMTGTSAQEHIYRLDRETGDAIHVSVGYLGAQSDGDSMNPDISADGNFIVYESLATNLQSITQVLTFTDIFVFDGKTPPPNRF